MRWAHKEFCHESSRLLRPQESFVDTVDDPRIEKLTDVIVKLTTTNICGSDLHMYEGRTDVEKGKILGHENLGEVVEVGKAVDSRFLGHVESAHKEADFL